MDNVKKTNIQLLAEAVQEITNDLESRLSKLEDANKKLTAELADEKKKSKQKIMEAQKFAKKQAMHLQTKIVILTGKVNILTGTVSSLATKKSK